MWYIKEAIHQIWWRIELLLNAERRRIFNQATEEARKPFTAHFWRDEQGYYWAQDLVYPKCVGSGKSYAEAAKWLYWCRRDWFDFLISSGESITETAYSGEYWFIDNATH